MSNDTRTDIVAKLREVNATCPCQYGTRWGTNCQDAEYSCSCCPERGRHNSYKVKYRKMVECIWPGHHLVCELVKAAWIGGAIAFQGKFGGKLIAVNLGTLPLVGVEDTK